MCASATHQSGASKWYNIAFFTLFLFVLTFPKTLRHHCPWNTETRWPTRRTELWKPRLFSLLAATHHHIFSQIDAYSSIKAALCCKVIYKMILGAVGQSVSAKQENRILCKLQIPPFTLVTLDCCYFLILKWQLHFRLKVMLKLKTALMIWLTKRRPTGEM